MYPRKQTAETSKEIDRRFEAYATHIRSIRGSPWAILSASLACMIVRFAMPVPERDVLQNRMKTVVLLLLFVLMVPVGYSQSPQSMTIKLYFPNNKLATSDCVAKVFPVERKIPKTLGLRARRLSNCLAVQPKRKRPKAFILIFLLKQSPFFGA